jgi:hypothetical protein
VRISRFRLTIVALLMAAFSSNSPLLAQRSSRMEIVVERNEGQSWRAIDPRLVLNREDRVRFRVKSSFDGYLYVTYLSTSGRYDTLFPGRGGDQNKVLAGKEYIVPQTAGSFRVTDPPGQEIVYFLLSPVPLSLRPEPAQSPSPSNRPKTPSTLVPRCDDSLLRTQGDCLDTSAGPKPVGDAGTLPSDLARIPNLRSRELTLTVEQNTAVITSAEAGTGPVIYEVRLSHK